MFGWLRKVVGINPEERQNLTTFSVMAGEVSLLAVIGLLVYVLRYSWPAKILELNATTLIAGLFNVVYGLLGLLAIQTAAKAAIALGGKIKATLPGGTSVEADCDPNP